MEKRKAVRYPRVLLPAGMDAVTIQWEGDSQIESKMVTCSAQGVGISIPPAQVPDTIPNRNDTILVEMLLSNKRFTGLCVYSLSEEDGSVSIGIFFPNPYEQNLIQHLLYQALKEQPVAPDAR